MTINKQDKHKEELREDLKELKQEFLSSIKDIDTNRRIQLKQDFFSFDILCFCKLNSDKLLPKTSQ